MSPPAKKRYETTMHAPVETTKRGHDRELGDEVKCLNFAKQGELQPTLFAKRHYGGPSAFQLKACRRMLMKVVLPEYGVLYFSPKALSREVVESSQCESTMR